MERHSPELTELPLAVAIADHALNHYSMATNHTFQ